MQPSLEQGDGEEAGKDDQRPSQHLEGGREAAGRRISCPSGIEAPTTQACMHMQLCLHGEAHVSFG